MLLHQEVVRYLRFTPPALQEIIFEVRNMVAAIAPDATEEIRHGGLVYFFGELGGPVNAGICGIAIKPDHIRLYFTHGAFIPDPKGLLLGTGKAMRYIRLENFESVPWEDICVLIAEHANFDPRSFRIS